MDEKLKAQEFRKKPVVIKAIQWLGTNESLAEIRKFMKPNYPKLPKLPGETPKPVLIIETLEGNHEAKIKDWIIRGVQGEFYPCKPDIFKQTYESATLDAGWQPPQQPADDTDEPMMTSEQCQTMIRNLENLHHYPQLPAEGGLALAEANKVLHQYIKDGNWDNLIDGLLVAQLAHDKARMVKLSQLKGHWRLTIKADDNTCEVGLEADGREATNVISYERDINWCIQQVLKEAK